MTTARERLVNPEVTLLYHCISQCVCRASLFGEESAHRKQWIEERPQHLVKFFAVDLVGFALTPNPMHLQLRLDPGRAKS